MYLSSYWRKSDYFFSLCGVISTWGAPPPSSYLNINLSFIPAPHHIANGIIITKRITSAFHKIAYKRRWESQFVKRWLKYGAFVSHLSASCLWMTLTWVCYCNKCHIVVWLGLTEVFHEEKKCFDRNPMCCPMQMNAALFLTVLLFASLSSHSEADCFYFFFFNLLSCIFCFLWSFVMQSWRRWCQQSLRWRWRTECRLLAPTRPPAYLPEFWRDK